MRSFLSGLTRRWRRLVAPVGLVAFALVAALLVGVSPSAAQGGHSGPPAPGGSPAVGQAAAAKAALKALGVRGHTGGEIVFGLPAPVAPGTVIREAGPSGPGGSGRVEDSTAPIVATPDASSWVFYDDLAPYQQFEHSGRLALVNASTGKVTVSRDLAWPPSIGGRLLAFLRTQAAYDGSTYRVFYRPYQGAGKLGSGSLASDTPRRAQVFRPSLGKRVAQLLAAQHACAISSAGTLPGGYYAISRLGDSRDAMDDRFAALGGFDSGFQSFSYGGGRGTLADFVDQTLAGHGCRDVLLYLAGGGFAGDTAVNLGMTPGSQVAHQDVTVAALRGLIAGHPSVRFELMVDAPYSSGFTNLRTLHNVMLVGAAGSPAFSYLPEAMLGGSLFANPTNPERISQFTKRVAFGLSQTVDSSCEVDQLENLHRTRQLASAQAYLLFRALGLGGGDDFAQRAGLSGPPAVWTSFKASRAPNCQPTVTARPDSYAARNVAALSVPASQGVLANDSDSAGSHLGVDELNGHGSPLPLHGVSAKGASVTVNRNGSFTYDSTSSATLRALAGDQTTTDSFTYRAVDAYGSTGTAKVTLRVRGVHRAPVLSGIESSARQYGAGSPAVPVTSSLAVSAPDSATLAGATVAIGSGLVPAEDSLGFTNQNGITGSYDSATGVLTLSGAASVADYQTALRSVTFNDSNGTTPTTGTRTVSFQVNDGGGSHNLSNTVARPVSVNPNSAPTAGAVSSSTDKHTAIDINVLGSSSDPDGDPLSVASVNTTGTLGSVSANPNGTIHYDPNGQFESLQEGQTATETFTYRVSDGYQDSSSATVTVTINGSNAAPVLSNIEGSAVSYDAGTPGVQVTNALTVADPDDTMLQGATVSIGSGFSSAEDSLFFVDHNGISGTYDPSTGVLSLSGSASLADYQTALRSVTYSDSNGSSPATGTRTVSFQVDDGHAANHASNTVSRDVTVNPNPAPTVNDDTASTGKHAAIDIPVLANDSDSDGDPLSVSSVDTTGTFGSVSINPDGTIHYDPNGAFDSLQEGQTATDTFTYKASDGYQDSSSATVTITINGSNDAPVLSGIEGSAVSYDAGTPAVQITNSLAVSDGDDADLQGATVSIGAGFVSAEDSLGITNQNGITGSYDSATGVLTLSGAASVGDYQTALRSVTFSDPNGAAPTTGTRTISFQVDDGHAANNLSNTVSRDVTVNPNPAPTANADTASTDKGTAIDIPVLANDTDSDGDTLSVSSVDTTGTLGSVSINPDGTIHYDPNGAFDTLQEGQTATDTFTYKASDGFQDSSSATVTVTINGSNAAPVLSNIESSQGSYFANQPAVKVTNSLTVADPDDATLQAATVSVGSGFVSGEDVLSFTDQNGITGVYNSTTGVLSLSGPASLAAYQSALRSITYSDSSATPTSGTRTINFQVDDGHGANNLSNAVSRDIAVSQNSPPTASNDAASTDKNTPIDINALANDSDPDGDTVSVASIDTTGTKGLVTINGNGTIHYDPNGQFQNLTAGQTATDTFTYKDTDGFQDSGSATVTVTINGVNDPPVLSGIEAGAVTYRAQDPGVQLTSALSIADDDDTTMSGATVSITSGFSSGNDQLQFTDQNGITGSYNATTGVLTLSGSASLANYQAALRSVDFFTSDGSVSPANRVVSFAVTDSLGATSNTQSRTVDVTEANQTPTAGSPTYNAVGNTTLGVGTTPSAPAVTVSDTLLAHASDSDSGGAVTITGNTDPAHGSLTLNPDGTFTYLPDAGYSGADSFTYTVSDEDDSQNPKSATGTVTINVGTVVWYVNDSLGSAGTGQSTSPFNTLAAANSALGTNSDVFLYQGNATYTGGLSLKSGDNLFGQPHGLTVSGHSLVAAGGSIPAITNSSGDGIDLGEGSDVEAVNVSSPSGNGVAASGINSATVGGSDSVAISGAGGDGIHISGGNSNLTFTNTTVTGSTGHSLLISNHTGGTASFGGTISDTGTGISLTSNTGATINLSGKITASTTTHPAFTATGGGTVTATAPGSALTTTTGDALDVENTTIGSSGLASGLNFQSISSNGATNGIKLASTGSTGSLTVSGTGTAGSGGTIQSSTGDGISLSSTTSPSFTDIIDKNNAGNGINGLSVSGFTLAGSTISGNGGTTSFHDGLNFGDQSSGTPTGLTGTATISNSTITGSADSNMEVTDNTGSLNLTVTGSTFSNTGTTEHGNDGMQLIENGTVGMTVSVTGSTFTNNDGDQFFFETVSGDTGTNNVTFSNNTVSDTAPNKGGEVLIDPATTTTSGTTTVAINNNTITGAGSSDIQTSMNGGTGTLKGTISGNTLGNPAVACSGSYAGNDLTAAAEGSTTMTLQITNNNIYQYDNVAGINVSGGAGSPTMNMTITGNHIANPVTANQTCTGNAGPEGALWGLVLTSGTNTGDAGTVCADISGNSMTGSAPSPASGGIDDFEFDEFGNGIFKLPGYTGASTDSNAVVAYVQNNNNIGGPPSGDTFLQGTGQSGGYFFNTASCPTPS